MKKYSLYTLVLLLFGIIILVTSFCIYLLINVQRERLVDEGVETKIYLAETINELLYSPFWLYRLGMFPGLEKALISEMAKFKDVVYIRIVSTDGRIHQSTIKGEWGKRIEEPELLAYLPTKTTITIEEIFQEEKIKSIIYPGYGDRVILIGFSLEGIKKTIREMIVYNVLFGFGNLVLIILIIFLILRKEILNPLKKITATCEKIRKGNLALKVDIKSKTEIGELVATFNEMIKDLKESKNTLEEQKNILEIKVNARTKELKKLSESLEEQVKDRTEELQKRVNELERFHKVTVGREVKMVELKKEIAELKEKLEKFKG